MRLSNKALAKLLRDYRADHGVSHLKVRARIAINEHAVDNLEELIAARKVVAAAKRCMANPWCTRTGAAFEKALDAYTRQMRGE